VLHGESPLEVLDRDRLSYGDTLDRCYAKIDMLCQKTES
jgi:hypothetical protein